MVDGNLSQKGDTYAVLTIVLVVVLISALGLICWNNFAQKNSTQKESTMHGTRPDRGDVLTLSGKVTMKLGSCSAKSLYPDEDVSGYDVCDSGKGLRIDDKIIYTSSGGPQINGFHVDIDSINLGDIVSVRYVVDEDYGGASLNCKKCSVIVTKPNDLY